MQQATQLHDFRSELLVTPYRLTIHQSIS